MIFWGKCLMTANSDGACLQTTSTNLFLESIMDIIQEPLIVLDANFKGYYS